MLSGGNRELRSLLQSHIRLVILRRQRLFQPSRSKLCHRVSQVQNRLRRICLITHAPPRMRVDHQTHIRANGGTHLTNGLQVGIRAAGGTHFISRKTHACDRCRFLGKSPRLHIHPGTPVKLDPIPLGTTRDVTQRTPLEPSQQVHHGNLNRAISLGQFKIALKIKAWPSAWFASLQERRDNLTNLPLGPFVSRPWGKTAKAIIGSDPNIHRVPLQHRPHPAIKR